MAERTDAEVLSRKFSVTLGGEVHDVPVKSILGMVEFREALSRLLGDAIGTLGDNIDGAKLLAAWQSGDKSADKLMASVKLEPILQRVGPWLLTDGLDTFVSLLWLYEPDLEQYRDGADDCEIIDGALEVLRVVFPLVLEMGKRILKFIEARTDEATATAKAKATAKTSA